MPVASLTQRTIRQSQSCYTHFARWQSVGFFLALWRSGLAEYDDMYGIAWRWQSIDGAIVKAPLAQEAARVQTRLTGKKRQQASSPGGRTWGSALAIVVTGANRHDVSQLAEALDGIVIDRPDTAQHLCADKGYAGDPAQQTIRDLQYTSYVKQRGEGKQSEL